MLQHAAHPGEVLKEEFDELGVTPAKLARQIEVPPNRLGQIINGKRTVTDDTALRLGHWFKTDPQFWLSLQAQFELAAQKADGEIIQALPIKAAHEPKTEQPLLVRSKELIKYFGYGRLVFNVQLPKSLATSTGFCVANY
jgi:antitoxin HigA-1